MSSTALVWMLIYAIGSIATFVNPLYGMLTYMFAYYTNPPLHWWSDGLPEVRWSFTVSLLMAGSYVIHRAGAGSLPFFAHPQTKWLVGLIAVTVLVSPFAVDPALSWHYSVELVKKLVLYYLFVKMLSTLKSYRWIVLAHVAGGLYWGLEAFFNPDYESGRLINVGGPDSDTSNLTAVHILTILPFVGYYILAQGGPERWLSLAAAPFILRTLVALNSRGSMIGLGAAGLVALVLGWRSYRGRTLLAMGGAAAAILIVGGEQFMSRQSSVMTYEEDYSATSRIEMWQAAVEMVQDHPLGVGGHGYDLLSARYLPDMVERREGEDQTVHNTYLLTAAEWGVPGLICLLGLLISMFVQLHRLRRVPAVTELQRRIHLESIAIEVGLVGLMVAGFFVNRLYGEALYWLAGLSAALANIQAREARERETARDAPALGATAAAR